MPIISTLICVILIMLSMAFFTLLEHNYLGYSQHRKGPNNILPLGLGQPGADAINLFINESPTINQLNPYPFTFAGILALWLALILWTLHPSPATNNWLPFSTLIFLIISSCTIYPTALIGWSSNSNYSLLGGVRSIAQTISYEISIVITLISILIITKSWSLTTVAIESWGGLILTLILPPILLWLVTTLAESNRAPFDFVEGESELVSGFNTEYGSTLFVLIFISEYLTILFIAIISNFLVINWSGPVFVLALTAITITLTLSSQTLLVRSSFPRLRYDRLIALTWTSFLPLAIIIITIYQIINYN